MKPVNGPNIDVTNDVIMSNRLDTTPFNFYGTEHEDADDEIERYLSDGDKAFRELVHMLEIDEPKVAARMIKPLHTTDNKPEWLMTSIICLSVVAICLILIILTILVRRKIYSNFYSKDKSK